MAYFSIFVATTQNTSSETQGLTRRLVTQVRERVERQLPSDVDLTARLCILDWIGVTCAGATEPLARILLEEALSQKSTGRSTIVGSSERCSPHLAAMVNASSADALDFSDGNLAMHGHTTPAVIATAFALGQDRGANAGRLLRAIVAGIEMECLIGLIGSSSLLRRGFHPTGNLATFGAATTAAYLLDLNEDQWCSAIGLAATQASGLLASGGSMAKPFHSGKAALNGILSASLSKRGFISNAGALESPNGFLATHAGDELALDFPSIDSQYLIMGTIFKSHAACLLTHSSIENMLLLGSHHGVNAASVEHVELLVPRSFMSVCNIPEPYTSLEAKFSLRCVVAMTLLGDDTRDVSAYLPERIHRKEIRDLIGRISVTPRDDIAGVASTAVVTTKDGAKFQMTSDTYKPIENMHTKVEIVLRKYRTLVVPRLGQRRASELETAVMSMSDAAPVEPVIALLVD